MDNAGMYEPEPMPPEMLASLEYWRVRREEEERAMLIPASVLAQCKPQGTAAEVAAYWESR